MPACCREGGAGEEERGDMTRRYFFTVFPRVPSLFSLSDLLWLTPLNLTVVDDLPEIQVISFLPVCALVLLL